MKEFSPDDIEHIQTSFRDAKFPGKQIGILADLYAASDSEIRNVLGLDAAAAVSAAPTKSEPAIPEQMAPRGNGKRASYTAAFKTSAAGDVLDNGLTLTLAARKHKVPIPTINRWVREEKARREEQPAPEMAFPSAELSLPPEDVISVPESPMGTQPPFVVYRCDRTEVDTWRKATDDVFPSLEAASRFVVETALHSKWGLEDMKIVQEYPVLPVWEGRQA